VLTNFNEFQWAIFLYWAVSYKDDLKGNKGSDLDYINLMSEAEFLRDLRSQPNQLKVEDIQNKVIGFLNLWKCRIKGDDQIALKLREVLVQSQQSLNDLKSLSIFDFNNSSATQNDEIQDIYSRIDKIPHFGPTAIAKTLHILQPSLFVMWDNPILSHYHVDAKAKGYIVFLSKMNKMVQELMVDFKSKHSTDTLEAFLCQKLDCTLRKTMAKFLDEYNWITITKGLSVPPKWWPS